MNQKVQLLKNTMIIALGKLGTQIVSFLMLNLYTSRLSPGEYGTYDFLVTLSVFLLPIITLLMEESMFRFLIDAEDTKSKKRIITATVYYIIFGTILFTIIASIIVAITKYEYGTLFIIFVISNILIALSNALSRGVGKIKIYSISNFILGILTIALNILLIVGFNMQAKGLLLANTIANVLTAVVVLIKLRFGKYISKKTFSKKTFNNMIKYSIPLVPNNLSWIIISLSDRLMLTWLTGSDANGIYSIANRFPNIIYTCYGFFSTAWKESAARIVKEENKQAYYNSIYKETKTFLKAIVLGLIAVMPFMFSVLINDSYSAAYQYIPILTIGIYYTNMSNFYGGIYAAYKDTKIMGTTTILGAILNVTINLIFMPKFGIIAATASTLVATLVVYIYRRIKLRKYIKIKEKFNIYFWLLLGITLVAYYLGNTLVRVIVLLVVIAYCYYTNRTFLRKIINPFINKLKRKKETNIED